MARFVSHEDLLASAEIFDQVLAEKTNPESDRWDPRFVGADMPFTIHELAESIVYREDIPSRKGEETDEKRT